MNIALWISAGLLAVAFLAFGKCNRNIVRLAAGA